MDMNVFSVFLTVVEEMNFTKAAERLYMTQQGLSGYIKRLEENYHVVLFERKPRLRLTPEGEAMVVYAQNFLENEKAMVSKFADISGTTAAVLRIGLPAQRAARFFPEFWDAYHPMHPNIAIKIETQLTLMMTEKVRRSELDLSMAYQIPQGGNLETRPILSEANFCAIHRNLMKTCFPNDWEARVEYYAREGVDLLDLQKMPFATPPSVNSMRRKIDDYLHSKHIVLNAFLESPDQSTIAKIALRGTAVGIITPLTAYDEICQNKEFRENCFVFKIKHLPLTQWRIVYRNDIEQPQYVMDMIDTIEQVFAKYAEEIRGYGLV